MESYVRIEMFVKRTRSIEIDEKNISHQCNWYKKKSRYNLYTHKTNVIVCNSMKEEGDVDGVKRASDCINSTRRVTGNKKQKKVEIAASAGREIGRLGQVCPPSARYVCQYCQSFALCESPAKMLSTSIVVEGFLV